MNSAPGTLLSYQIALLRPEAHEYQVQVFIPQPNPQGQCLRLPAWVPGSYLIRDFAKHVLHCSATCNGAALAMHKQDKHTWVCAPCPGPLQICYTVYAFDKSVRGAYLDLRHGFWDGASLLLEVVGQTSAPCHLRLERPTDPRLASWRAATAMPALQVDAEGFGAYQAADYAELIDHPFLLGQLETLVCTAGSIPHRLVIQGRYHGRCDPLARLCQDTAKICAAELALFGASPVQHYVFLLRLTDDGYGGLEHRNSCSLIASRDDLPRTDANTPSSAYRKLLGLISHEYFHTWWVKSLKPRAFCPYDLSRESYTELLWVFEGITSYYDDLLLLRAGVISRESYLELLGQNITRLWRTPGRARQSLAEASFDAWTKFYQPNENSPNSQVSYYLKGGLVALLLDLTLRQRSDGQRSLDGLLRQLWQDYRETGLDEHGFEHAAGAYAGFALSEFFAQTVHGTAELALQDSLGAFGIQMHAVPASSGADGGGYARTPPASSPPRSTLGATWSLQAAEATLSYVFTSSAAQQAGLSPGDTLIAVDGLRISGRNLEARINAYPPGSRITLHFFRRDELLECSVTLQAAPADTCYLSVDEAMNPQTLSRHSAWLG